MTEIDVGALKAIREPFPDGVVGKLPREGCYQCGQVRKGQGGKPWDCCARHEYLNPCGVCGGKHGSGAIHLDFVGHADLTDRLLTVDPLWVWEPVAFDADGLPMIRDRGGELEMWIRLTVGGVSRLGVGSCPSGQFEASKVLIGDALRNAAMRFGAALDLWSKSDRLESQLPQGAEDAPAGRGGASTGASDDSGGGAAARMSPARAFVDAATEEGIAAGPMGGQTGSVECVDDETRERFVTSLASTKEFLPDSEWLSLRLRLVEQGVLVDSGYVIDPMPVVVHTFGVSALNEAAGATRDELAGVSQPETYKKEDLMAFKPGGMGDAEFVEAVLERARALSPATKPDLVLSSWGRLQRRPALVREVVDQVEAGLLLPDGVWLATPEPFGDVGAGE